LAIAANSGYFFFRGGETEEWLDKTVNVPTVNSLTLAEWMAELQRLSKLNDEILAVKPESQRRNESGRRR
jgi:hypothetical protein